MDILEYLQEMEAQRARQERQAQQERRKAAWSYYTTSQETLDAEAAEDGNGTDRGSMIDLESLLKWEG